MGSMMKGEFIGIPLLWIFKDSTMMALTGNVKTKCPLLQIL